MFYLTDTEIKKEIVDIILESNDYSDEMVYCEECSCIEDEYYHCCRCEGSKSFSCKEILELLYNVKYKNKESRWVVLFKEMVENSDVDGYSVIFFDDHKELSNLKSDPHDEYICVSFSDVYNFLVK